jgi:23S rRNA (adenine2503-C2)-methyltransferase
MDIIDKIYSKTDKTIKFIFRLEDQLIAEVSYIDKDDGKDIFCVPSHTSCNLGCRFCHTSDAPNVVVRKLDAHEITDMVQMAHENMNLNNERVLLVSYMGCGEPLLNLENVTLSMILLRSFALKIEKRCRFAIATLLPKMAWVNIANLADFVKKQSLHVKVHLSLHFTSDEVRHHWMPQAIDIEPSICALEMYKKYTNESVEIHYTMIEGVNDSAGHANILGGLLQGRGIPVKLLQYNQRSCLEYKPSIEEKVSWF